MQTPRAPPNPSVGTIGSPVSADQGEPEAQAKLWVPAPLGGDESIVNHVNTNHISEDTPTDDSQQWMHGPNVWGPVPTAMVPPHESDHGTTHQSSVQSIAESVSATASLWATPDSGVHPDPFSYDSIFPSTPFPEYLLPFRFLQRITELWEFVLKFFLPPTSCNPPHTSPCARYR
jgi:hypothetical protein